MALGFWQLRGTRIERAALKDSAPPRLATDSAASGIPGDLSR